MWSFRRGARARAWNDLPVLQGPGPRPRDSNGGAQSNAGPCDKVVSNAARGRLDAARQSRNGGKAAIRQGRGRRRKSRGGAGFAGGRARPMAIEGAGARTTVAADRPRFDRLRGYV